MSQERIEKYQAHIERLEEEQQDLQVVRRRIKWVPLGLVTAPLGLIWGMWVALSIALGWVVLIAVTQYLNRVRRWWIVMELEEMRRELARVQRSMRKRDPGQA